MLARGGMAVVYLVHQPTLDRDVVLKRLDLEGSDPAQTSASSTRRGSRAHLDHPNIVTLFDFFEHDGVPYIAMEYVAGGSLRGWSALELPQVFGVVEGVLAGLATRRSTASRTATSSPRTCCSRAAGASRSPTSGSRAPTTRDPAPLDRTGMAIGTPTYMAPEQARRRARPDDRPLLARRDRLRAARGRAAVRLRQPLGCSTRTSTRRRPPLADIAPGARRSALGRAGCSRRTPPPARARPPRPGTRSRSSPSRRSGRTGAGSAPIVPPAAASEPGGNGTAADDRAGRRARTPARSSRRRAAAPPPLAGAAAAAQRLSAGAVVLGARPPPRRWRSPSTRRGAASTAPARPPAAEARDALRLRRRRPPGAGGRPARASPRSTRSNSGAVLVLRRQRRAWTITEARGSSPLPARGTTSAPGSRARTSTATATPTSRSARPAASASPCSTAGPAAARRPHASSSPADVRSCPPARATTATRCFARDLDATATAIS